MKIATAFIFSIFFFTQSYSQKAINEKQELSQTPIAIIEANEILFQVDTLEYKLYLENRFLPDHEVSFDHIEIKKQFTLGTQREFYYLLLTDENRNIKVAKWLNLKGDSFYINDEITVGTLFEQTYLICEGSGDCDPQVFEDGSLRMWGCTKEVVCKPEEGKPECKAYKVVLE